MRRALVLTNEAAGHPFRRSLPAQCLRVSVEDYLDAPLSGAMVERDPEELREPISFKPHKWGSENASFFAASFASGFVIFYGFIV